VDSHQSSALRELASAVPRSEGCALFARIGKLSIIDVMDVPTSAGDPNGSMTASGEESHYGRPVAPSVALEFALLKEASQRIRELMEINAPVTSLP